MHVLVTGGNYVIGHIFCNQLLLDHDWHVLLTERSEERGGGSFSEIELATAAAHCERNGLIDFLIVDVSDEAPVAKAAARFTTDRANGDAGDDYQTSHQTRLGAIVNNARIGFNTESTRVYATTCGYETSKGVDSSSNNDHDNVWEWIYSNVRTHEEIPKNASGFSSDKWEMKRSIFDGFITA